MDIYGKYPSFQDFVFAHFGNYCCTEKDSSMNIVLGNQRLILDDHIITCQSQKGSLIALQSFIMLCNT
jgi:hypothetical protein